jgi:hypothetical protein
MVSQSDVNGASFSGVHRLQGECTPGTRNPVRNPQCQPFEDLGPTMPILFNVQHYPAIGLVWCAAQQQVHHELHASEGLSAPADKQAGIVAGYLNQLRVRGIIRGFGYG